MRLTYTSCIQVSVVFFPNLEAKNLNFKRYPISQYKKKEQTIMINQPLKEVDPEIAAIIENEKKRQNNQIELIASENFAHRCVMEAQGSVLTNKYAEGYPRARYYGGCEFVDGAEELARDRLQKLFGCEWSNVQPHSGSQANQGVFLALLKPGDTILGMDLSHGGHLSHGAKVSISGKWFNVVSYGTDPKTGLIDMDVVESLAKKHKPKLIIAGASAYPRIIDFAAFRNVADDVGAYLLADIAHYAGLIATGLYPSPFPHAHIVTSTTHKTLRGPRGGIIMGDDMDLYKRINSAIFPGLQGGPLMHVIAAKAVAFKQAGMDEFKNYSVGVLANARVLAQTLMDEGIDVLTGGTDCHMVLVSLLKYPQVTGAMAEGVLESHGMTCNKNGVPNDPRPPRQASGIRLGTPAATSRGFGEGEFRQIGQWIASIIKEINTKGSDIDFTDIKNGVDAFCKEYPLWD